MIIKVIAKDGAYKQYVGKLYEVQKEEASHYIVNHTMDNRTYSIGILKSHCEEVFDITSTGFGVEGTANTPLKLWVCDKNYYPDTFIGNGKLRTTPPSIKFDIQSAKKIRRFPSGAVRSDDTGRPRPDWVSALAIEALGEHLAGNANDFGATNYLKGIPVDECLASLMRHYCEYKKTGNFVDLRSLAFNAVAALHTACLIKDGDYKEVYPTTELVDQEAYLKELNGNN
jgi:hypothetical protein